MKKEIIFAILLGLTLGLIITYGVYRAKMTLQQPLQKEEKTLPSSTPQATNNSSLLLISPEDEIITDQEKINVAGTTTPDSFVIIIVNDQDQITTADQTGNFSVEVELEKGSNVIRVHALKEDGTSIVEERTVIYSTIDFATSDETPATGSGETTNEK